MPVLDRKGLSWFVKLFKDYIGTSWSMSGDTNDILVLINDDLNDYTTIGNYYCRPDNDAKTVSNNPANSSFILKVYSGGGYSYNSSDGNYLTQHLEDLYGNIWIRYKTTDDWSAWNKIFAVGEDTTVGSDINPIYVNNGILTASASTVGSGTKPIYLNNGVITNIDATVGESEQPIYLNNGLIEALTSTIGGNSQPTYLNNGEMTASSSTVGGSSTPVYLKSGVVTACTSVSNGGIKDYKLGTSGYVRYNFGLIIQWGTGSANITYPISFKSSSSYAIVKNIGSSSSSTAHDKYVSFYSRTAKGATTYTWADDDARWLAIGY